MIPIQDLLNRIRWDPEFGRASFRLGYWDRVDQRVVQVPFHRLHFPEGDHFAFDLEDLEGEVHHVPLHRVRDVYRDGKLIWHREPH
ncbi:MAG: DUF504 domain-containing protein [Desulfuromonas sp.]|uniref:DUF504 domain-containing protein n=1 Tax=Desulfuromonas sp. TaxID=892 RepID=UPI000CB19B88|nr:DUF504 domain-containing protein [Desulfuromonas sp.]PLX84853.1 MAG: DUF504 domain-containing protein [Desulfuromonas sp.]